MDSKLLTEISPQFLKLRKTKLKVIKKYPDNLIISKSLRVISETQKQYFSRTFQIRLLSLRTVSPSGSSDEVLKTWVEGFLM